MANLRRILIVYLGLISFSYFHTDSSSCFVIQKSDLCLYEAVLVLHIYLRSLFSNVFLWQHEPTKEQDNLGHSNQTGSEPAEKGTNLSNGENGTFSAMATQVTIKTEPIEESSGSTAPPAKPGDYLSGIFK